MRNRNKPHRPVKVLDTRLAGVDHAVVTVEGDGATLYRREPCATCPWRLDAVGEFPPEAFRHSANTGIRSVRDAMSLEEALPTFACHQSGTAKPTICAGYILRGDQAIGWRVALTTGQFDPGQVHSDVKLFRDYYEMAVANGVPPDDPALKGCKPWRGER